MTSELIAYTVIKKFFIDTFTDATIAGIETALNARSFELFEDEENVYDVAGMQVWGEGPFYGSITYYQVYQQTPDLPL